MFNIIQVAIFTIAASAVSVDNLTEGTPDCLGEVESSEESAVFDIDLDGLGTGESTSDYVEDN